MNDALKLGFGPLKAPAKGVLIVFCDDALKFGPATRKALGSAADLVARAPQVDAGFLHGDFPPDRQRAFAEQVVATLGMEEGSWRIDPTAHPFCTSFSNRDVRLTTRYREHDLESVWSTLHEAGHGLYAHGIADSLQRTPLANAPSLGLNESQSRTWENLVGRSLPFWKHWYGPLQETFPEQLGGVPLADATVQVSPRANTNCQWARLKGRASSLSATLK